MQIKEIQRGDLFYYDFGKREGSVQSVERPVMVIQADNFNANAPTIIVAAVTAVMKKKYLPSHIILGEDFGLKKPSMVLLEQIQTVNKGELTDYIGSVNDERLYFLLKPYLGTETVSWVCILGAAPFAALGFVKYNGMTAEKFIWAWIKSEFLMPKKLVFHSTNTYYELMKPTIEQKQKEAYKNND